MSRWYRAYEGMVTDPKIGEDAVIAGCSRSVAIAAWAALLESCCSINDGGRFDMTARRLSVILGETSDSMAGILNAFEELAMTEGNRVAGWGKYETRGGRQSPLEWFETRTRIFHRDDFTCAYCGERGGRLECDHVVPVSRGGSNDDANLVTACMPCNRSKRDKLLSEWRQ